MEFKRLKDVLGEGKHIVRVFKKEVKDNNGYYVKGTHDKRQTEDGRPYYLYNTDVKYTNEEGREVRVILTAWDEEKKELFDSGTIEVNIVKKRNKNGVGYQGYIDDAGEFHVELIEFYNKAPTNEQIELAGKAIHKEIDKNLGIDKVDDEEIDF